MLRYCILVAVSLASVNSQTPGCDYYQQINAGQTFYAYSPGYPNSYPQGLSCRWIAMCPNARCKADCADISLPSSPQCSMDRLLISKTGDPQLYGASTFCGSGTTSVTSEGDQLSIGLVTSTSSNGGRFRCQLTSIPKEPPPTCSCGYRKMNRIVGGVETGVNEFPMMAGLVSQGTYSIYCGATIIDKRYLLTAAHCLKGRDLSTHAVVVGEHNVMTNDTNALQLHKIADVLIHPQHNTDNNDNDIALIMVQIPITFSPEVGPACLPFKYTSNTFAGSKATALGWGTLFFGGPTADALQKVDLDIISNNECNSKDAYPTTRQFCTYTKDKDSCQIDSGGPLLFTDPSTGLLFNVGVISYGQYCATNHPSINTRVTSFMYWITSNTLDADYCIK